MLSSFTLKKSQTKASSSNTNTNTNNIGITNMKLRKNFLTSFRSKRSVANSQSKEQKLILSIGGRPLHLQEIHAKGSTSNVWKVLDTTSKHDSYYALKAVPLQQQEENTKQDFFEVEQRARLEIDALKQIQQENVVTLLDHEWGSDDPFSTQLEEEERQERRYHRFCYLLMPLYPMNLMQFVQQSQSGRITDKAMLQSILQGVCRGLTAVHQAGYRHNDVRPENILIRPLGAGSTPHVLLADFGSVSPANIEVSSRFEADRQKQFHKLYSQHNYTAPELWVVLPRSWITPKTDAFSVGCTLYFLLLGKSPFEDTRGLGRRLTFPKKHGLDFFFYHLCLAFLLKSPQKRLSIEEATKVIFHMELTHKTHSSVYEEFHMFHDVQKPVASPNNNLILTKQPKWKKTNNSSVLLSSISSQDLEAVRETHFTNYLGDDDSDEETVMTEDEDIMKNKFLIRRVGCSLSY